MDAPPSRHPEPDPSAPLTPSVVAPSGPEHTVRLADAGDVAAALPHLLGFRPAESVVLVGLGGASGNRVGLTLRADIPPAEYAAQLARSLAARLDTGGPGSALLAIVSEVPDVPAFPESDADPWEGLDRPLDLPHRFLAWHLSLALTAYGIALREQLLVRGGRWWSYDCPEACCAPGGGAPVPGGVTELAVASTATGHVLAASREELAARIARSTGDEAAGMAGTVLRVGEQAADHVMAEGHEAAADRYWEWIIAAVARSGAGRAGERLTDEEIARVAWGLRDRLVRDRALGLALGAGQDAAERLWAECTRRAPPPLDAAPATLLAVAVWLRGDGAMARIALDRALDSDPGYSLAMLLSRGLDGCLPPRDLRAMIVGTLADLGALDDLGPHLPDDLLADFHGAFPGEDPSAADGALPLRAARAAATPGPGRARRGRRSPSRTRPRRSPE